MRVSNSCLLLSCFLLAWEIQNSGALDKARGIPSSAFFQEYQDSFPWGSLGHPRAPFSELELLYVHLRGFKITKTNRQLTLILLLSYWFKSETRMCFLDTFFLFLWENFLHPRPCSCALHSSGFTTWHHLHFQTSTWQGGHRCPAGRVCKHRTSHILLLPVLGSLPQVFWYLSGAVTPVPKPST